MWEAVIKPVSVPISTYFLYMPERDQNLTQILIEDTNMNIDLIRGYIN